MQNIENIMIDNTMSSAQLLDLVASSHATRSSSNTISGTMNGVIKEKLKIIPKDVM